MKSYINKLLFIIFIIIFFVSTFTIIHYAVSEPSDSFKFHSMPISKMQNILNIIIVFIVIFLLLLIISIIKRKKISIIVFSILLFLFVLVIFFIPVKKTYVTGGLAGVNRYDFINIFSYTIYTQDNKTK